ncbi:MAG: SDR family NAD(P)-dependent oxidoreductase, partial [Betaproteobacteria bacterium]|nr:SDR family NAD(P)-dependent oxidoreductase [Betaproteobacteria bacterium]
AGEFIPATLGLLGPGGRFIEIGKSDDWDAARVREGFPSVEYTRLYLGEVTAADPARMRERLQGLLGDVSTGSLTALPRRLYPVERAEEAFRCMAQGHHVGKIVITQAVAPVIRGDASYLVTGGLGGLGLAAAEWLAAEGARHLVLLGRSAPQAEAHAVLDRLRAQGVQVEPAQADVADAGQLARVLGDLAARLPPLRGVIHAAGRVDDGTLAELEPSRFATVLAPKVRGAWNLHRQTAGLPLDFFVLFSAGAALLGAPGQGNYAAANSFMDGLAHLRAVRGLPALSVNWGSWSGTGMAAKVDEQHRRRWAAMGLRMIEPVEGVRMLGAMLRDNRAASSPRSRWTAHACRRRAGPFSPACASPRPGAAAPTPRRPWTCAGFSRRRTPRRPDVLLSRISPASSSRCWRWARAHRSTRGARSWKWGSTRSWRWSCATACTRPSA